MIGAAVVVASWIVAAPSSPAPAAPPAPALAAAAADEEQAFAAIDRKEWCLATRLFERAHSHGPAADLLMNASQAAEYGGDLGGALQFVDDIKALSTADRGQKSAASKRRSQLASRIKKTGTGTPCPALPEPAPPPLPPPPPPTTTAAIPPPPEPLDARALALGGAGVGTAALLLGGATVVVGVLPWFAHESAASRIVAAEKAKADAATLQQEQAAARGGWESYGQGLTVAGAVVVGVGVVAIVAGLGLAVLGPPSDETSSTATE